MCSEGRALIAYSVCTYGVHVAPPLPGRAADSRVVGTRVHRSAPDEKGRSSSSCRRRARNRGAILMAFAIDAWWDEQVERREEPEILAALATDFSNTRATVLQTTALYEQARDSTYRLLALMEEDLARVPPRELFALIRWSLGAWSFEPRLPTYSRIVNSGSLGLIRSDALRSQMAVVVDELEDGQDYYRGLFRRGTTLEDRFLIEHAPGYELWRGKGGRDLPFPDLDFPWDANELRTRQFASILAVRQAWTSTCSGSVRDWCVRSTGPSSSSTTALRGESE